MQLLTQKLKKRLTQPLPGLPAQLEMAPPARGSGELKVPDDVRHSAVLAFLYPHQDAPHIALMKRADDGHVHSGQISFPGGKVEDTDRDYSHTALREAEEELGIPQAEVELLGRLTDMYIPVSNFLVVPYLGVMPHRPDFVIDPKEVAQVVEVDLDMFWQEEVKAIRKIEQRTRWGHYETQSPSFKIREHIIWGATAMMLNELLLLVKGLD